MSNRKNNGTKLAVRIVAAIMAALMILGVVYMAFAFTIGAHALPLYVAFFPIGGGCIIV